LKRAFEQFAPKVGVRLQIPVLAKDAEDGLVWIMEYPFFNEPEQRTIAQPFNYVP
jgi:hypothetical protein